MTRTESLRLRRRRTSPEQRARWVRRFRQSNLTQRDFARRHRLGLSTLTKWLRDSSQPDDAPPPCMPALREISIAPVLGAPAWVAEVSRPDGFTLRVTADIHPALLEQLLPGRLC